MESPGFLDKLFFNWCVCKYVYLSIYKINEGDHILKKRKFQC